MEAFLMNFFRGWFRKADDHSLAQDKILIRQKHTFQSLRTWKGEDFVTEEPLTPGHELYTVVFPDELPADLEVYQAGPEESMLGLSLKFDISELYLKELNPTLGSVIPSGAKVRIPRKNYEAGMTFLAEEQCTRQVVEQIQVAKFEVTYCAGSLGSIRGYLTLNGSFLMFAPNLQDEANVTAIGSDRLLRFNSIIEIEDISSCGPIVLPSQSSCGRKFGVEVILRGLGNKGRVLSRKSIDDMAKMLEERKGIGYLYLFIYEYDKEGRQLAEYLMMEKQSELRQSLTKSLQRLGGGEFDFQRKSITFLPYFQVYTKEEKGVRKNVWDNLNFRPQMIGESIIFTHQRFLQVLENVPDMLKMNDWQLFYSTNRDGTNFNSMQRLTEKIEPVVLALQTVGGEVLGAYLTDSLRYSGDNIFGRGEMFVFRQAGDRTECFFWTQKNKFFTLLDEKGIAVGMGVNYGLFLDRSLRKGFSHPTQTFDSPALADSPHFEVRSVEVWGPVLLES